MKTCSRCKGEKTLEEMAKQKGSPDGRSSWCAACYRDVNRLPSLERARQRRLVMNAVKSEPCTDCGGSFPPECMDFDHVRGIKHKGIGRLLTCSEGTVQAEIAKCELVCACCHRVRTYRDSTPKSLKYAEFAKKIATLKSHPCVDCGHSFIPACMDFDHVRGVKAWPVSKLYKSPWDRVLQEIAKCDLVCANCHRIRTADRKAGRVAA